MTGIHHLVFLLMLVMPLSALLLVALPFQPAFGWMFWLLGAAGAIIWWVSFQGRHPQTAEERIIAESSDLIMSGFAAIASWPVVWSLLVWLRRHFAGASKRSTRFGQMAFLLVGSVPTGLILILLALGG